MKINNQSNQIKKSNQIFDEILNLQAQGFEFQKVLEKKFFVITIRKFSSSRVKRIREKPKIDPPFGDHKG
jgi:hypothetical protein